MTKTDRLDEGNNQCPNPNWSDNCDGTIKTEANRRKGLCQGCRDVIRSWGNDESDENDKSDEGDDTEQTTLFVDGGSVD